MIQVGNFYVEHSVGGVVVRIGESHATAMLGLRVPHEQVDAFCDAMQKIAKFKDLANLVEASKHRFPKYIAAMCKDAQIELAFDAIENLENAATKWGMEREQVEAFAKLIQP